MSKLQPSPEVFFSIDAHRPGVSARLAAALMIVAATGCLSPESKDTTTDIALTDSGSAAGTEGESGTTLPPVMTTTEEPETTNVGSSSSGGADSSTGEPPLGCGDGSLQPPEECDYGLDNADDGECTSECKKATCGDGKVNKSRGGLEVCDDGVNDGSYDGCNAGCMGLAAHCGDGEINGNEACDEADPKFGCLIDTCQFAESCREIRDTFINDDLQTGVYTIKPTAGDLVQVLCDMEADGGGYTFLKVALEGAKVDAMQAEAKCAEYGMRLLVPRTPEHVVASTQAAKSTQLDPVGGGATESSKEYLSILGIYPVKAGQSCANKPFTSAHCPQWQAADEGPFYVTSKADPTQPAVTNCLGCSMRYTWNDDGTLQSIEAFTNGGIGAETLLFMCDVGDKQGLM